MTKYKVVTFDAGQGWHQEELEGNHLTIIPLKSHLTPRTPGDNGSTTEITVDAADLYDTNPVNTSIPLSIGQRVLITAFGMWHANPATAPYEMHDWWYTGPDGDTSGFFESGGLPEFNNFSLLGRIGESGDWFSIGAGTWFTATESGTLYLANNDDNFDDLNLGSLTVQIIVNDDSLILPDAPDDALLLHVGGGPVFVVEESFNGTPLFSNLQNDDAQTLLLAVNGAFSGHVSLLLIFDAPIEASHQGPAELPVSYASADAGETAGRISLRHGEKRLTETDLILGTPVGSLAFTRSYRREAQANFQFMGLGWTHNHHITLQEDTPGSPNQLLVTLPQGGVGIFNGFPISEPAPGGTGTLAWDSGDSTYTLTLSDRSSLKFEATSTPGLFHLTERNWPNTEVWTYIYDGSDQLTEVEDGHGRSITFEYWDNGDHIGQLKSVSDHNGRMVQFDYDTGAGGSLLTEIIDVFGNTWSYAYYSGENPDLQDFLTERISPEVDTDGDGDADEELTLERLTYQIDDEPIDILANGNMEQEGHWKAIHGRPPNSHGRSSGPGGSAYEGDYCWHVDADGNASYSGEGIESEPFNVIAGRQYTIRARVYCVSGTVGMAGWFGQDLSTTTEAWEELLIEQVGPQEFDGFMTLQFFASGAAAEFYVDAVSIMETNTALTTVTQELGIQGTDAPLLEAVVALRPERKNMATETIAGQTTRHLFANGIYAGSRDAAGNAVLQVGDSAEGLYRPAALIDGNANLHQILWGGLGKYQVKLTDALGNVNRTSYDQEDRPVVSIDGLGRQTFFLYDDPTKPRWPSDVLVSGMREADGIVDGGMDLLDDEENPWQPISGNEPLAQGRVPLGGNSIRQVLANAVGQGIESNTFQVVAGRTYQITAQIRTFQCTVELSVSGTPVASTEDDEVWESFSLEYTPLSSGAVKLEFTASALGSGTVIFEVDAVAIIEFSKVLRWEKFTYNGRGQVLSHRLVDPADGTTTLRKVTNDYYADGPGDGLLQTTAVHDRDNDSITLSQTFQYNELGLVKKVTDELERVRLIGYDEGGRVVRVVESASNGNYDNSYGGDFDLSSYAIASLLPDRDIVTDYVYDTIGRLVETKTAVGTPQVRRDLTAYDALGRVIRTIQNYNSSSGVPSNLYTGSRSSFGHGTNKDRNLVTDLKYSERGLLAKQTDPAGVVTLFGYDKADRLVKVITSPSSPNYNMSYAGGDPDLSAYSAVADSDRDIIVTFEYDPAGNLVKSSDPLGNDSITVYDALNRAVKVVQSPKAAASLSLEPGDSGYLAANDPRSASYTASPKADEDIISSRAFDAAGNLVKSIDPLGNASFIVYDALDRVVKMVRNAKDDATVDLDPGDVGYDEEDDPRSDDYEPVADADRDIISRTIYEDALRIEHTEDPVGVQTWVAYDGFNRVVRTILNPHDPETDDPREELYTPSSAPDQDIISKMVYNDKGQVEEVVDPLDRATHYVYDALDRPLKTIANFENGVFNPAEPDQDIISKVAYNKRGWLTDETNPLGNRTRHDYDSLGRRNKTIINYSRGVRNQDFTDLDRITKVAYDLDGQPDTVTDAAGVVTRFEHDKARRRTKVTANYTSGGVSSPDANVVTQTAYNKAGLPAQVTDPRGSAVAMDYDKALRPRAVTKPNGVVDWTCYDKAGQALRAIQNVSYRPGDAVTPDDVISTPTSWLYNPVGHGGLEDTDLISTTIRDCAGRVTHVIDSLGVTVAQMFYDKDGTLLRSIDAGGFETRYIYDGVRRLKRVVKAYLAQATDPASWVWNSALSRWDDGVVDPNPIDHGSANDRNIIMDIVLMDKAGRQLEQMDPNGNITATEYDDLDRQLSVTDPLANTWQTAYSNLDGGDGFRITATDANGHQMLRDLDRLGRPKTVTYADAGTSDLFFHYDVRGDMVRLEEKIGSTPVQNTTYGYDALHRLTLSSDDVLGQSASYEYDRAGFRTRLTPTIGPAVSYGYDTSGLLKQMSGDPAWEASFRYDGADRLVSIDRANGLSSRYQSDAGGRLTDIRHYAGNTTFGQFGYQYDSRDLITQALEYVPFAGDTGATIEAAGVMDPGAWEMSGDFRVSDQPGEILKVGSVDGVFANLVLGTGPDHGLCGVYIEDDISSTRIDLIDTHAAASGEAKVTVTVKAEGRKVLLLKNETNLSTLGAGSVVRFKSMTVPKAADGPVAVSVYDALGRLSQTQYPLENPARSFIYSYDRVGNTTQRLVNGPFSEMVTFQHDAANRLAFINGSQAVESDDNGNILNDGSMTYTWDRANRLIQVNQGPNTYAHAYNGLGQRVKLTQNGVETRFLYDGVSRLVIAAQDAQATSFMMGPMGLHAQQTGTDSWLSVLIDGQDNLRSVVQGGQQAESRRYAPHGNLILETGEKQTPYGFGGGHEDPSGLNYLFTEFYSPALGQPAQELGLFPALRWGWELSWNRQLRDKLGISQKDANLTLAYGIGNLLFLGAFDDIWQSGKAAKDRDIFDWGRTAFGVISLVPLVGLYVKGAARLVRGSRMVRAGGIAGKAARFFDVLADSERLAQFMKRTELISDVGYTALDFSYGVATGNPGMAAFSLATGAFGVSDDLSLGHFSKNPSVDAGSSTILRPLGAMGINTGPRDESLSRLARRSNPFGFYKVGDYYYHPLFKIIRRSEARQIEDLAAAATSRRVTMSSYLGSGVLGTTDPITGDMELLRKIDFQSKMETFYHEEFHSESLFMASKYNHLPIDQIPESIVKIREFQDRLYWSRKFQLPRFLEETLAENRAQLLTHGRIDPWFALRESYDLQPEVVQRQLLWALASVTLFAGLSAGAIVAIEHLLQERK